MNKRMRSGAGRCSGRGGTCGGKHGGANAHAASLGQVPSDGGLLRVLNEKST